MNCALSKAKAVLLLACFTFVFSPSLFADGVSLSDSSSVSLLTCSPGEELYSAFGHTGIRVTDYKNNFDVVFNYGTFDFGQPGFYTNFVKGKLLYMVSADRYMDFEAMYIYEKRSVSEQVFDMQNEDKQALFDFLYINALPENCQYRYDFFWDNCATRPRDVFEKIYDGRITYDTTKADFEQNKTMHDMLRVYVGNRPWVDFGFDLILGMPCEVPANPRSQTFLPDYLAKYFDCALVDGKPLVKEHKQLLKFPPAKVGSWFTPLILCILLLIGGVALSLYESKKGKWFKVFDVVLFFIFGLLGSLFALLWAFSEHYSVPYNLNLLWLVPTHLVAAFLLLKADKFLWLRFYLAANAALGIVLLLTWHWNPQFQNTAFIFLILLISYRSSLIYKRLNEFSKRTTR